MWNRYSCGLTTNRMFGFLYILPDIPPFIFHCRAFNHITAHPTPMGVMVPVFDMCLSPVRVQSRPPGGTTLFLCGGGGGQGGEGHLKAV